MRNGYSMLSGFANPALAATWSVLHRTAELDPNPVNFPVAAYRLEAEKFADFDLVAVWRIKENGVQWVEGGAGRVTFRPAGAKAWLEIEKYEPDRVELAVDLPTAGEVVLAEPWYPGWEVWVDGVSAPAIQVDGWQRGVAVTAGVHQIEWRFHSRWLGASIGSLCWAGWWWFGASIRLRQRR